ncbi:MAG: CPBP family intramembrane glutamic endopeptidase [Myxococcota bacterium]
MNAPPWPAIVAWFLLTHLSSWPVVSVVLHGVAGLQGVDVQDLVASGDGTCAVAGYLGLHWTVAAILGLRIFEAAFDAPTDIRVLLGLFDVSGRSLMVAVAVTVGLSMALSGGIYALHLDDYGVLAHLRARFQQAEGARWLLLALLMTLAPAFGEEFFFRGFVLRTLAARYGAMVAVLGSSLMFAVSHLDPLQSSITFVLGIAIGWSVLWTGSLWTGIVAHAANNAVAACMVDVGPSLGPPFLAPPVVFMGTGLILAGSGIWGYRRLTRARSTRI